MHAQTQQKSYQHVDFKHPDKGYCDLVMKGGITSGVVYPAAILELAQRYEFCDIGGTSAGAIAAAVTAAAEMGREHGGYQTLDCARVQLQKPGFLRKLFQPSWWTAPLMNLLLDLLAGKRNRLTLANASPIRKGMLSVWQVVLFLLKLVVSCIRRDPLIFVVGLLGTLALHCWLLSDVGTSADWWLRTLGLSVVGGIALCLVHMIVIGLWLIYRQANFFGLCSGLRRRNSTHPGLTDWLSAQLDLISGKVTTPLNYEDMERAKLGDHDLIPLTFEDLRQVRGKSQINLKMVTTNLSNHQPYLLPFEVRGFLFKEDELRQFFPPYVVKYMANLVDEDGNCDMSFAGADGERLTMKLSLAELNAQLGDGHHYHILPEGDNLPVIVAMRMSLSFPILFKAVPLWTINTAVLDRQHTNSRYELKQEDLQQHLLSDGGTVSNFPIHFFDAWLPTHPTFGINLTNLPREAFSRPTPSTVERLKRIASAVLPSPPAPVAATPAGADKIDPMYFSAIQVPKVNDLTMPTAGAQTSSYNDAVYLPAASDLIFPAWQPIPSLIAYLGAMFETMMNYRDNTQSMLPGYRERIIHIRLDEAQGEGGLNLKMSDTTIAAIDRKGSMAGALLSSQFNFEHHQWVRFRVLMAQLEGHLSTMREALADVELPSAAQRGDTIQRNNGSDSLASAIYRKLVEKQVSIGYPFPAFTQEDEQEWRKQAIERIDALCTLLQAWSAAQFFAKEPPIPVSILRVTPEL